MEEGGANATGPARFHENLSLDRFPLLNAAGPITTLRDSLHRTDEGTYVQGPNKCLKAPKASL